MSETNITVTVENLAPENGTFITPTWVGFHNGEFDTYDRGRQVSPGLESLAEDGATEGIAAEFLASGDGTIEGTLVGLEGVEGPIDPGESVSQTFTLDSDDPNSRYFNYASMVLPSNDAFIANGNPLGVPVFDDAGNFIGADFIVYGDRVLDAGTEINDELANSTAFFGQSAPNTGETEDGVVKLHPGFIDDGRILTEDGSDENAVAAFTSADFSEPGYQLARISVRNTDDPLPPPPDLVEVTITVENLSPENGTALTPLWFGLHDGDFDTYDRGRSVSDGLESLAEDGDTADISGEFLASGTGFADGTVTGDDGATPGIIDVGETTSLTFTVDRSLASSRYLNYASMVLPSNDAFVANGNPMAHQIFDADGNFTGADFVISGDEVLDAGTEVNDEAADSTAFFGQSAPNTGETENGVVGVHPGFEPEGRILSSAEFANADFTADSFDLARITVTTEDLPTVITEDSAQSVEPSRLIQGTENSDRLLGGANADYLSGGAGDDFLDGAEGRTIYNGGAGSDTFVIHNDAAIDWVQDFELGTDTIALADDLTFGQLEITGNNNSFIFADGEKIGVLLGVNPEDLTAGNFEQV